MSNNFLMAASENSHIKYIGGNYTFMPLSYVVANTFSQNISYDKIEKCNFDMFINNTVNAPMQLVSGHCEGTTFTGSAHVSGDYETELLKASDGSYKLKYIDPSGNLVIDNANA